MTATSLLCSAAVALAASMVVAAALDRARAPRSLVQVAGMLTGGVSLVLMLSWFAR